MPRCTPIVIACFVARRYFEYFMLEYKSIPVNLVVSAVLLLSAVCHCIFAGIQNLTVRPLQRCEALWSWVWVIAGVSIIVLL